VPEVTDSEKPEICKIEVFTAVTMKNAVFWDIRTQFLSPTSQETHYVSTTELSRLVLCNIDVSTTVTMNNSVFWDMRTLFLPHRSHMTSPLQNSAS
jgi:hypothetical protein